MKYSPALAALGLVAAMLAAAGPAAADTAPAAPLDDALARDLGLSAEQARGLLTAQNEAAEVDAAAMEIESYAGSAFDVRTRVLTVRVTDEAAVAAVEALGAEAEVVDTDPDEVVQALNAAETPEGVVGWYPDDDGVVVEVLPDSGVTAVDLGVPDKTVHVRVVEAERPSTYGQIIGGHQFTVNGGRCTIGFSARGGGNVEGFLTAGHCGRVGDVFQGPNGPIGVFRHSVFPGSDGAFVQVSPPWVVTNLVERYSTTYLQVTGSTPAPVGSAVCLSSPTYGWQCGTLQARNQTVSYPQGSVQGLFRTNLCAGPGDSGAPIVSGNQAQGIVSGGSGSPGTGCTTFGQEINPLLAMWGLTLVTS
ncbi:MULTISPECIES: S1 family peptidase [unclassified Nocardiopsis]|uniref:S1 family peptidase n=1 Tax=Nocardiopsis TaxID=2013 RepID=UPI00387B7142